MQLDEFSVEPKQGPQAVYVHCPADRDTKLNLLDTFLPQLEKIEGVSKGEYLQKQKDLLMQKEEVMAEFMPSDKDEKSETNRKETKRMLYDPNRFYMQKLNKADSGDVFSAEGLLKFMAASQSGERPLYFRSE